MFLKTEELLELKKKKSSLGLTNVRIVKNAWATIRMYEHPNMSGAFSQAPRPKNKL